MSKVRNAIPPTTPPTIAPIGDFLLVAALVGRLVPFTHPEEESIVTTSVALVALAAQRVNWLLS